MTDECHRCGIDSEHHGEFCDPADIVNVMSLDSRAGVHRTTEEEVAPKASREDPVARAIYRDAYPVSWDEPDAPDQHKWAVRHRRVGWTRSHTKYFQRHFFAVRRFRRLLRSSGCAGLSAIEDVVLLRRTVSAWIIEKDLPWRR
jgi:hypothetical protein